MERYLRARTAYFDRVAVNAIERGDKQVVCIGAGYDGRALRYAHDGVRWFEVDHPTTSADKRSRLAGLGIDPGSTTFVPWDLSHPGVADELVRAGFDPDGPAQFICEGVVVYLEPQVFGSLLDEVRSLAAPGTRLALSLSVGDGDEDRRARFRQTVERLGEPVRSPTLTTEEASERFRKHGWEPVEVSERSPRAGLVMLRPIAYRAGGWSR